MRRWLRVVAMCCFALPSWAQEGTAPVAEDAAIDEAKAFLEQYLASIVKAGQGRRPRPADVSKKLASSRKYVHPKTLELIAQQEKRQVVSNALAVWHWAKNDYWLTEYEIGEARTAVNGTWVVEVDEKNWRVEEGGVDGEPEPTSYLIGKHQGRWVLIDKRRNTTFTDDAIRVGYEGYFEAPPAPAPAAEKAKPAE